MQAAQKAWIACVRMITSQGSPWLLCGRSPGDLMAHRSQIMLMSVSSKIYVCCRALGHATAFSHIHWVTDFLDDYSTIVSVHGVKKQFPPPQCQKGSRNLQIECLFRLVREGAMHAACKTFIVIVLIMSDLITQSLV